MIPALPESVSVVVPVYNERDNLRPLVLEVRQAMETTGRRWELLLVNDGSGDGSGEVIDELAAEDDHVRALHLARNSGQSAALAAGFRAARGRLVGMLDADLQNDPADLPYLLDALDRHGAVVGWRRDRQDTTVRRLSSVIANSVRNALTHDGVRDTGCSLKVLRRDAVSHLTPTRGMHRFLPALVRMQGYSVIELPVHHRPRRAGVSKYGIGNRLWVGIGDLLTFAWMGRRAVPLAVARETGRGLPGREEDEALSAPGDRKSS